MLSSTLGFYLYDGTYGIRQGLLRVVEWAESGKGWSSRGIVEQEVTVQEGDFFVIADESEPS